MTKHTTWRVGAIATVSMLTALLSYGVVHATEGDGGSGSGSGSSDFAVDSSSTATVSSIGPFGGNTWDVAIDPVSGTVYTVAKDSPNGFYKSVDGGTTWTGLSGYDLGGSTAIEINPENGTVFVVFNRGTYSTTDGGTTMTRIIEDGSQAFIYAQNTLMMGSNMAPGTVNISTDDGATFTNNTVTEDSTVDLWWLADGVTDGVFYAIGYDDSDGEHLYSTNDAGSTWTEMTLPADMPINNYTSRLAVNPLDPTVIALTTSYSDYGYISTDTGATWTPLSISSESCVYDQEGRLYFAESYSDDNGTTWGALGADESTGSALGGHNLTVDPTDVNVLYVDGMPGLEKSTDRGLTWEHTNQGITGVTMADISQADNKDIVWAAAYNGIGKTENFTSGTPTWEFPLLLDPGSSVWAKPDQPDIAVVGLLGAIKRTTDGGATWSDDVSGGLVGAQRAVADIIQDVSDENTLYAAVRQNEPNATETGTVLVSHDLGETWEDTLMLDDASVQSLSQDSAGVLYAGVGGIGDTAATGIYTYSTYSDSTWTKLDGAPTTEIIKVIVDPTDDTMIFAVASIAYGNNNDGLFGFYKSVDRGVTWTEITSGISENDTEYNSLALQASTTPHTLYLGAVNSDGQGILYKSSDAGDNWGVFYTGFKSDTYYTMIFDGVTAGSTQGLFNLSSKARVSLKKNASVSTANSKNVTLTLRDSVTNKILKHREVRIMRKTNGHYKRVRTVQTNKHGKVTFNIKVKSGKTARIKAVWTPKGKAATEYAESASRIVTFKAN